MPENLKDQAINNVGQDKCAELRTEELVGVKWPD